MVCPNAIETDELKIPEHCPKTACMPPINTNVGLCWQRSYALKWKGEDLTGWECVCEGDSGSRIAPVTGCNSSPVCPNQQDLITNTPNGMQLIDHKDHPCPTTLPSLPFLNSCDLIEGAWMSSVCKCGISGDPSNTQLFSAFDTSTYAKHCFTSVGLLCPNSVHDRMGRRAPQVAAPGQYEVGEFTPRVWVEPMATATGPVLAVTTEATPGSAPTTAAEPTILVA